MWTAQMVLRTNFKAFWVVSSEKIFFENLRFFYFFAYPGSQISWKMTNFFFERYRPEIFRGLHKWCCERILRCFGSFRARKFFLKIGNFLTFFAYPGSQISWKMTNFFFERYRPEICRGLHKWCCEQILSCFRSFPAKKNFSKVASFLTVFAYPGSQISWKMTNYFFERYWPEIYRGLHKWCCEQILRRFRLFRAKKIFLKIGNFLTLFAYPGSQISWKMTNFLFERYRPEICRGLHKWCCKRILRCFRSLRAKKKFSKVASFSTVFAYRGSQISWKMTNFFFERYRPEIRRGLHKWCCERISRRFRFFQANNFFLKIGNFLTLFAYPGSQISWKMTNYFFERYQPEICRGLHKWCCKRILRCFRSLRAKKKISKVASFLMFFAYPGSQISWKMTNFFFERYRPEICRGLHKWCCERISRRFKLFQAKNFFFENWQFFDSFCISGVRDFLKNS